MIEEKILYSDYSKAALFEKVRKALVTNGFEVVEEDQERPWGGFFVINEAQIIHFRDVFFPGLELDQNQLKQKLSPKILMVAPGKRLSWQYHHRRAEVWKLVSGEGGLVRSPDDQQRETHAMSKGEIIRLSQGERHRLIGLNAWGIIAEIWMHTDPGNPSDEEDIIRVEDDFHRN